VLPSVMAEDQPATLAAAGRACHALAGAPATSLGAMLQKIAGVLPGHAFASVRTRTFSSVSSPSKILLLLRDGRCFLFLFSHFRTLLAAASSSCAAADAAVADAVDVATLPNLLTFPTLLATPSRTSTRARLPQPLPSSTSLPSPPAFLRAASPATRPAAQNHASHAPARGWRSVHADPRAEHGTGAAPTTRAIAVQPNPRCISADSRGPQAMYATCSFNCLSWRICFLPVKYVC